MKIDSDMIQRAVKALEDVVFIAPLEGGHEEGFCIVNPYNCARAALEAALNPPTVNKRDGEHG